MHVPNRDPGISMRPGSATLLPVSTASTGLLCLSFGACVHCVRSNTELSMWLLPRTHHIQCVTILGIPGWVPTKAMQSEAWAKAHLGCDLSHQVWTAGTSGKGNTLSHQRVFPLDPYMDAQARVVHAMVHLGGKDGLG